MSKIFIVPECQPQNQVKKEQFNANTMVVPKIEKSIDSDLIYFGIFDMNFAERRLGRNKRFVPKRDQYGDMMTNKAIELEKRGLWQKGKFMKPIRMSDSVKVSKNVMANAMMNKKNNVEKQGGNTDQDVEHILMNIIRLEAEERGTNFGHLANSRQDFEKVVDVDLIKKIESFTRINRFM